MLEGEGFDVIFETCHPPLNRESKNNEKNAV